MKNKIFDYYKNNLNEYVIEYDYDKLIELVETVIEVKDETVILFGVEYSMLESLMLVDEVYFYQQLDYFFEEFIDIVK